MTEEREAQQLQSRVAYNQKDAAAQLSMSVGHFVRHVRPALRSVYVGDKRLFARKDLERWVEKNAVDAPQRP